MKRVDVPCCPVLVIEFNILCGVVTKREVIDIGVDILCGIAKILRVDNL